MRKWETRSWDSIIWAPFVSPAIDFQKPGNFEETHCCQFKVGWPAEQREIILSSSGEAVFSGREMGGQIPGQVLFEHQVLCVSPHLRLFSTRGRHRCFTSLKYVDHSTLHRKKFGYVAKPPIHNELIQLKQIQCKIGKSHPKFAELLLSNEFCWLIIGFLGTAL